MLQEFSMVLYAAIYDETTSHTCHTSKSIYRSDLCFWSMYYYQGPRVEQTFNVSLVTFLLIQIQKKLCPYYGKLNTNIVIFFSDLIVNIRTPRPVTEHETRKVASGQDLNCSSDAPVTHCHYCRIASPTALAHELSFAPGESTTQRLSVQYTCKRELEVVLE